jgi:hypothetical protein
MIPNVLNYVMEKINPTYELNEKEELILDIVTNLCNQSDTDFPIPSAGSYYLVNRRIGYWIKISDDGISITNHTFTFMSVSIFKFKSILITIIEDTIQKNSSKFESDMFENEIALLKNISDNICDNVSISN